MSRRKERLEWLRKTAQERILVLDGSWGVMIQDYKLTEEDFLSPGIVVKAQALIRPDAVADPLPYPVFIECLFPSQDATTESFQVGNTLMLEKQRNCAAILNVGDTFFEDRETVFVTVVPLAAVEHTTESGVTFKISPPAMANPEATFPAFP